jgi:glycosyltransferase involved in cell wall biosynthesis
MSSPEPGIFNSDSFPVVVYAPSYPPAYLAGGPSKTLEALVASAGATFETFVITPSTDLGNVPLNVTTDTWIPDGAGHVLYEKPRSIARLLMNRRRQYPQFASIVYLNSLFNFRMAILPLIGHHISDRRGARLLLAPRGELDPGALNIRRLKKKIFLNLARASGIYSRVVWHASSALEVENIQKIFGKSVEFVIREDETSLPNQALPPTENLGPFSAIFIGRISPKKGLHTAISAICMLTQPAVFDVFGPNEDDEYLRRCLRLAKSAPDWIHITFHGPLTPTAVISEFQRHDAFIFPTEGENFGHVIAEALSTSCIVICPPTTPWTSRIRGGGGIIVETNEPEDWVGVLEGLCALSPRERGTLRAQSGLAFNRWQALQKDEHVFQLLQDLHPSPPNP